MFFYLDKQLLLDSLGFKGDFVHCKKNLKMLASSFRNPSQLFPILTMLVSFWSVTASLTFSYRGKPLVFYSLCFERKMLPWSFCYGPSQSPLIS